MLFDDNNKDFIKECLLVLLFFWFISFVIIFFRYNQGVNTQLDLQVEVMKSQNELMTRVVKSEIHDSIGDLIWYAKNEGDLVFKKEMFEQLFPHKPKYRRLMFIDVIDDIKLDIINEPEGVLVDGENHAQLNNSMKKLLFTNEDQLLVVQLHENGSVGLFTSSATGKYIVHMDINLTNFHNLKELIEEQSGFHVGLTSEHGDLWKTMGDSTVEPCVSNECEVNHDSLIDDLDSYVDNVIRRSDGIINWSCLACEEDLPEGIDQVIWINQNGVPETNIMVLSSISGQEYSLIRSNLFNEMKGTVLVVLFVQLVAAIVIAYVYQKYRQTQRALKAQATRDGLTGFLNRWAGFEVLKNDMALAEREGHPLAVAFIDIDKLKAVNDDYGHDDGDMLIRVVSQALMKYVRDADSLVRIGGDEFILILPNCEVKKANDILSRSLAWLDRFNKTDEQPWNANFSYGLTSYNAENGQTADDLVQLADQNMYAHKKSKRIHK